jgi:uncharacterized protein
MELCLVLDHACNLRCRYCYTGAKRAARMSREVIRSAVALALREDPNWLSVSLFGGEPLLHPGVLGEVECVVLETIEESRLEPSVRWLLNTNAMLLEQAALDWLCPPRQALVFVSLDGDSRVHDRNRVDASGRGSHRATLDGIAKLRERGIPFQTMAVVAPDTAGELGESLGYLLELGAQRICFQPDFRDHWSDCALLDFQRGVSDMARVWSGAFTSGQQPVVEPLHTKVLSHLSGGGVCPARCQLVTQEMAVAPSGRIYPCAEMVGEDLGGPLVVGHVDHGLDRDRVLELRMRAARVHEGCRECSLRSRCQFHCACRQLALAGELGRVTGVLCQLEACWIDAADGIASELVATECKAFVDLYYNQGWALAGGAKPIAGELLQLGRK